MTSSSSPQSSIEPSQTSEAMISPEAFLRHWQGHRKLTRRVIEAFPEDALFQFSIGGMRPFGTLALEIIGMAVPSLNGLITGKWSFSKGPSPETKAGILELWDATTGEIDRLWPMIPAHRFLEVDTAFGMWTQPGYELLLYLVDNEIHHRGQGYVYLRASGITPPPFYERQ